MDSLYNQVQPGSCMVENSPNFDQKVTQLGPALTRSPGLVFSQLPPMRSKTRLENKEPAIILSQFRHLIWQNNENLQDSSKFLSVHSQNEISSMCIVLSCKENWKLIFLKNIVTNVFWIFLHWLQKSILHFFLLFLRLKKIFINNKFNFYAVLLSARLDGTLAKILFSSFSQ